MCRIHASDTSGLRVNHGIACIHMAYTCAYMYACTYELCNVCMYVCMHVYMYASIMRVYKHVRIMYVRMHACM